MAAVKAASDASNVNTDKILAVLNQLVDESKDTRASLKQLALGVESLGKSHEDHKRSLFEHGTELVKVRSELSEVRVIALRADENANLAKKRVSDTVDDFKATMSAVNASQNGVASKANAIEVKTNAIAVETSAQTDTLAKIEAAAAKTSRYLRALALLSPVMVAIAVTLGTLIASAVNAYSALRH